MKMYAGMLAGLLLVGGLGSQALAEVQIYDGREMERVVCSLASPQACVAGGGRRVDGVGIWSNNTLHWHDKSVGTPANPGTGVYMGVSRFVRSNVLRQHRHGQDTSGSGDGSRAGGFRADVFYNMWEEGAIEGTTIGMNPTIMFGDSFEVAIRVPLYMTEIDGADLSMYHYGVDISMTANLSDYFALGVHGAYERDHVEDADFSDDLGYINGGPYASLLIPLGGASLSLGALFEYGIPEDSNDGDETTLVAGAANLGLPMGDAAAVNIFGIYYYHLDSELSDYNYADAGAELALSLGETWAVQVGGRMVIGLDHLDSTEIYLGSEWAC